MVEVDAFRLDLVIPLGLNGDAVKHGYHGLTDAVREDEGTSAPENDTEGYVGNSFCKDTTV